jgi:hypothetical protein
LVDSVYEQFREGRNITQFEYGLKNAMSTLREHAWLLKQYVNLDFRKTDTLSGLLRGFSLGKIIISTTYTKPRYAYLDQDADEGYYHVIYLDSTGASDSTCFKNLENSIEWCSNEVNAKGKPSLFRYFAGIKHNYIEVIEQPVNFYFSQFTANAGIHFQLRDAVEVEGYGAYIFDGYNDGDQRYGGKVAYRIGKGGKGGKLSLSGERNLLSAPWTATYFYGNYYRWNYSFDKQDIIQASLKYQYTRLSAEIKWTNLYHLIYFNEFAHPTQHSGNAINVFALTVKKDFKFGKLFRVDNKVLLQYCDNDAIVRVPLLAASQAYYFTFRMFKKALGVQTGIEAWYNTPYFADAWMPATRQFYLQNESKVGNYVYIDVFLNLQIKSAFLFLALDHANAGLWSYKYYTTPHHPATDRSFRFGVKWSFHD